jgi:SAM-dependent methyltransferase
VDGVATSADLTLGKQQMDKEALQRSIRDCYASWSKRYYADYYQAAGAYPPVQTEITCTLLSEAKATSVLDAGCGPASMLRDLKLPGLQRFGFDLTPEMVNEARAVLGAQGIPEAHIWQGSVLDSHSFNPPSKAIGDGFDAAICFGVLPHVPEQADALVLRHLHDAVRPGGLVAIEARNALFALFTLNRYSRAFFRDALIDEATLRRQAGEEGEAIERALAELDCQFRLDLPPVRKGYEGEQGYDEVLSRTHVPMLLQNAAQSVGLRDVRVLFYHYHALPPMLERVVPKLFRRASLEMEDPNDWRGLIMASAFILVGNRAE